MAEIPDPEQLNGAIDAAKIECSKPPPITAGRRTFTLGLNEKESKILNQLIGITAQNESQILKQGLRLYMAAVRGAAKWYSQSEAKVYIISCKRDREYLFLSGRDWVQYKSEATHYSDYRVGMEVAKGIIPDGFGGVAALIHYDDSPE